MTDTVDLSRESFVDLKESSHAGDAEDDDDDDSESVSDLGSMADSVSLMESELDSEMESEGGSVVPSSELGSDSDSDSDDDDDDDDEDGNDKKVQADRKLPPVPPPVQEPARPTMPVKKGPIFRMSSSDSLFGALFGGSRRNVTAIVEPPPPKTRRGGRRNKGPADAEEPSALSVPPIALVAEHDADPSESEEPPAAAAPKSAPPERRGMLRFNTGDSLSRAARPAPPPTPAAAAPARRGVVRQATGDSLDRGVRPPLPVVDEKRRGVVRTATGDSLEKVDTTMAHHQQGPFEPPPSRTRRGGRRKGGPANAEAEDQKPEAKATSADENTGDAPALPVEKSAGPARRGVVRQATGDSLDRGVRPAPPAPVEEKRRGVVRTATGDSLEKVDTTLAHHQQGPFEPPPSRTRRGGRRNRPANEEADAQQQKPEMRAIDKIPQVMRGIFRKNTGDSLMRAMRPFRKTTMDSLLEVNSNCSSGEEDQAELPPAAVPATRTRRGGRRNAGPPEPAGAAAPPSPAKAAPAQRGVCRQNTGDSLTRGTVQPLRRSSLLKAPPNTLSVAQAAAAATAEAFAAPPQDPPMAQVKTSPTRRGGRRPSANIQIEKIEQKVNDLYSSNDCSVTAESETNSDGSYQSSDEMVTEAVQKSTVCPANTAVPKLLSI